MIVARTYDGHFNIFGLTYRQLEDIWRSLDVGGMVPDEEWNPVHDALTRRGVEYDDHPQHSVTMRNPFRYG